MIVSITSTYIFLFYRETIGYVIILLSLFSHRSLLYDEKAKDTVNTYGSWTFHSFAATYVRL